MISGKTSSRSYWKITATRSSIWAGCLDPGDVAQAVQASGPSGGALGLMTTTLKSMEDTIALLHSQELSCKIVVGGAS